MRYLLYPLSILALIAVSCSSPRNVSIASTRPADIHIDPEIKSILIVNRADGSGNPLTTVEGLMTGEMLFEDQAATEAFMIGLRNKMQETNRFEVKMAKEKLPGGSLTSAFPQPLEWWMVEAICKEYRTDVLLAVEILDTDFIITESNKVVEKKNDKGKPIKYTEFYAEGVADMTIGVRIYDPHVKTILDQELFRRTNTWNGRARNEAEALAQLVTKVDASRFLANQAGSSYVYRIAPMPIQLNRSFVGKNKKSLEVERGARFADVGNWDQAIEVWKSGIPKAEPKAAGILAYNIAVAYEIKGEMNNAVAWAQRAYTDYGNNQGRSYYNQLLKRMRDEERAQRQMK